MKYQSSCHLKSFGIEIRTRNIELGERMHFTIEIVCLKVFVLSGPVYCKYGYYFLGHV